MQTNWFDRIQRGYLSSNSDDIEGAGRSCGCFRFSERLPDWQSAKTTFQRRHLATNVEEARRVRSIIVDPVQTTANILWRVWLEYGILLSSLWANAEGKAKS